MTGATRQSAVCWPTGLELQRCKACCIRQRWSLETACRRLSTGLCEARVVQAGGPQGSRNSSTGPCTD